MCVCRRKESERKRKILQENCFLNVPFNLLYPCFLTEERGEVLLSALSPALPVREPFLLPPRASFSVRVEAGARAHIPGGGTQGPSPVPRSH